MARARRLCAVLQCKVLAEPGRVRCATHLAEAERARGTSAQRGYGSAHRRARSDALRRAQPLDVCPRCRQLLFDGTPLEQHHSTPLAKLSPAERAKAPPGDELVHARCNPKGQHPENVG